MAAFFLPLEVSRFVRNEYRERQLSVSGTSLSKYSMLSTNVTSGADVVVAMVIILLTSGSCSDGLPAIIASPLIALGHCFSSFHKNSGPKIYLEFEISRAQRPRDASSAGLDFVSTYFHCFGEVLS